MVMMILRILVQSLMLIKQVAPQAGSAAVAHQTHPSAVAPQADSNVATKAHPSAMGPQADSDVNPNPNLTSQPKPIHIWH
jgi:hypothetical protein